MTDTNISLSKTSLAALEKQILKTAKVLDELKKKLILSMPSAYGSELWWEKEEILADQEITKGKVKKYKDVNSFLDHLEQLAP